MSWLFLVVVTGLGTALHLTSIHTHTIYVFGSLSWPSDHHQQDDDDPILRRNQARLQQQGTITTTTTRRKMYKVQPILLNLHQQEHYVRRHGCGHERFQELVHHRHLEHWATELYKYCALSSQRWRQGDVVVYMDLSSPFAMSLTDLLQQLPEGHSVAVLGDRRLEESMHGSLLLFSHRQHTVIAKQMIQILTTMPLDVGESNALLLPQSLYSFIATNSQLASNGKDQPQSSMGSTNTLYPGINGNNWFLLQQDCQIESLLARTHDSPGGNDSRNETPAVVHQCSATSEFCCAIRDPTQNQVVLWNRFPLLPFHKINLAELPMPLQPEHGSFDKDEIPFIATVAVKEYARADGHEASKNLYDILNEEETLPDTKCTRCLHMKTCKHYERICEVYLEAVCARAAPSKFVSKDVTLTPPLYRRDPTRLIPRIIHQTWYEELNEKDYPNMSRLVESFRNSGWEYKFYTDDQAVDFLKTHFPKEVLEAYQALIPGAFKADLFRYCALLIHGGVYADVDIVLESNLDLAIEPDIGFMVPMDEPDACVWQGFIASAPGHPFLVKAVETVVNQVRNRFTSVDIDATFCPTPNYKVLHMFDVLFTAGPCLLGASINRVLGRHGQTLLTPGELLPEPGHEGTDFVTTIASGAKIPGRTIILKQNKWDMAAHRFTLVERNLVVAATDLQDSDDRQNRKRSPPQTNQQENSREDEDEDEEENDKEVKTDDRAEKEVAPATEESKSSGGGGGEHYSKAHAKTGIYGLENLYVNQDRADDEIRFLLNARRLWSMSSSVNGGQSPTTSGNTQSASARL